MQARWDGQVLVASDGEQTVRVEVVPPDGTAKDERGEIQAVVRVLAPIPGALMRQIGSLDNSLAGAWNAFAALGALHDAGGQAQVGRLTVYRNENAWRTLQLPLLTVATLTGGNAILGAMRRGLSGESSAGGPSAWKRADFERAGRMLERRFACTFDRRGLAVEFPLDDDSAPSAAAGGHDTALLQLVADQPHPALGGGLLCLLQLPHRYAAESELNAVCARLNALEMAAFDLPPHFGAWCPGKLGDNVAYVSFLPNALHAVPGIALNFAVWALSRSVGYRQCLD